MGTPAESAHAGDWDGHERRRLPLSEDQIEEIAEKAAAKAIEKLTNHVYQEVGKSVVSKALYLIGASALGIYLWLKSKGIV